MDLVKFLITIIVSFVISFIIIFAIYNYNYNKTNVSPVEKIDNNTIWILEDNVTKEEAKKIIREALKGDPVITIENRRNEKVIDIDNFLK